MSKLSLRFNAILVLICFGANICWANAYVKLEDEIEDAVLIDSNDALEEELKSAGEEDIDKDYRNEIITKASLRAIEKADYDSISKVISIKNKTSRKKISNFTKEDLHVASLMHKKGLPICDDHGVISFKAIQDMSKHFDAAKAEHDMILLVTAMQLQKLAKKQDENHKYQSSRNSECTIL